MALIYIMNLENTEAFLNWGEDWDHDKCVRPMETKHKIRLESHIIREGQHVKRDIIFIFCLWSYLLNFVLLANLLSWSSALHIYIYMFIFYYLFVLIISPHLHSLGVPYFPLNCCPTDFDYYHQSTFTTQ